MRTLFIEGGGMQVGDASAFVILMVHNRQPQWVSVNHYKCFLPIITHPGWTRLARAQLRLSLSSGGLQFVPRGPLPPCTGRLLRAWFSPGKKQESQRASPAQQHISDLGSHHVSCHPIGQSK